MCKWCNDKRVVQEFDSLFGILKVKPCPVCNQKQLAMKIGCQRMTISRIEQEKQKPSLELAYSLANALDLKIEDLFLFENKERENV